MSWKPRRRTHVSAAHPATGRRRADAFTDVLVDLVLASLVLLAVLGMFAVKDRLDDHDCVRSGGTADAVGGPEDDLFTVCRGPDGRIVRVYVNGSVPSAESERCHADGGSAYATMATRGERDVVCVVDGRMAWYVLGVSD